MSLFAIKNDRDEWYDWDDLEFWPKDACTCIAIGNHEDAERIATEKGAHVVELVEKPAQIVVSEAEDKVLKKAKNTTVWRPAAVISAYAYDNTKDSDIEALLEDRLMRAYVIGYTVAKDKKYNVKVPLVQAQGGLWFFINSDDKLDATYNQELANKFTLEEIEHHGLHDCDKVEVTDDGEVQYED